MDSFGLVRDKIYNRRLDIHPKFDGNRYSGIAPAPRNKVVLIFSGKEGHQFGYDDQWDQDGQTFSYTGEGQKGHMEFTKGNLAIRDHVQNGHALLLFEKVDRSGLYRYVGEMQCAGFRWDEGPDLDKTLRKLIKFQLVRLDAADEAPDTALAAQDSIESVASSALTDKSESLSTLRSRAYNATEPREVTQTEARRNLYKRSVSVATYVLARASGVCEHCEKPAPFKRSNGTPYLEVHHIERLSDGGLDAPDHVVAICPSCHRRAHYGSDRKQVNQLLRERVAALEHQKTAEPT
jgi:5-methylcytosine-specific restriction protein A